MRVKIYEFIKRGIETNAIHSFIKTILFTMSAMALGCLKNSYRKENYNT